MNEYIVVLTKKFYSKTWFKMNLPQYFTPIKKGKSVVAIRFKSIKKVNVEELLAKYNLFKGEHYIMVIKVENNG